MKPSLKLTSPLLPQAALSLSLLLCACQPALPPLAGQPVTQSAVQLPGQVKPSGETERLRVRLKLPRGFGIKADTRLSLTDVQVAVSGPDLDQTLLSSPVSASRDSVDSVELELEGIPRNDGQPRLVKVLALNDGTPIAALEGAGYYVSDRDVDTVSLSLGRRELLLGRVLERLIDEDSDLLPELDLAGLQSLLEGSMDYDADLDSFGFDPNLYDIDAIVSALSADELPDSGELDAARSETVDVGVTITTVTGADLGEDLYLISDDPLSQPVRIPAGTASGSVLSLSEVPPGDWSLDIRRANGTILAQTSLGVDGDGVISLGSGTLSVSQAIEARGTLVANTIGTGDQDNPAIAANDEGAYALAWSGPNNSDLDGISLRLYGSDGQADTSVLSVNQTSSGVQTNPAVALGGNGNVIVVWEDQNGTDGSGNGVYGRVYNSAGSALSSEFRVSVLTSGDQSTPDVAADANGDFIVTWDDSVVGVVARRFFASTSAIDSQEFTLAGAGENPSIPSAAMNDGGEFVIAWNELNDGLKIRSFDAAGTALTEIQEANTVSQDAPFSLDVGIADDGRFVVSWSAFGPAAPSADGSGTGVFARAYDGEGVPLSDQQFQVSSSTYLNQTQPTLAMNDAGGYTIAWGSSHESSAEEALNFNFNYNIYFQRYNADGETLGDETRVNQETLGEQHYPAIAMTSDGLFAIAWGDDYHEDGRVQFQRYSDKGVAR